MLVGERWGSVMEDCGNREDWGEGEGEEGEEGGGWGELDGVEDEMGRKWGGCGRRG